jgi:hypothetical protein
MTCPDALDAARLASSLDGEAAVLLDEYFNSNTFTEVTSSASPWWRSPRGC